MKNGLGLGQDSSLKQYLKDRNLKPIYELLYVFAPEVVLV